MLPLTEKAAEKSLSCYKVECTALSLVKTDQININLLPKNGITDRLDDKTTKKEARFRSQ